MNIYEKAICDSTKALNIYTVWREKHKQQTEWCLERGRALRGMRNFDGPLDNLTFRSTVLNHLDNFERIFGVSNYDNPLLTTFMDHIWNALDVYHEDPQTERKEVRKHLAKALKEGRKIDDFLKNSKILPSISLN